MSLEVLHFINTHPNWEDILSSPPYNIIIKWKEPFVLLKYNFLNSDMSNNIVQECRGLILKKIGNGFEIASMRFKKFFNHGESNEAILDFNNPVYASEKIDGSLTSLWYDEGTGWHVSTSGNIDAKDSPIAFQTDCLHNYMDIFLVAFKKTNINLDSLDKRYTYIFELVSPYNRIVVPYKDTELYLLSIRDNYTLYELSVAERNVIADKLGVNKPRVYPCASLEQLIDVTNKLSASDENYEGFVLEDSKHQRIKLKSNAYLALFFLKGDGVFAEKKILKLILAEQEDDILSYFPEYTEDFNRIRRLLSNYISAIKKDLTIAENKLSLDRKDYALWAVKRTNPKLLFEFYNNKQWSPEWLKEQIENISIDRLLNNIKEEKEI